MGNVLRQHLWSFVWNKSASYVIETALMHCDLADKESISLGIANGKTSSVARLANNQSGVHVLGAILKTQKQNTKMRGPFLELVATELPKTRYGKLLLSRDAEVAAVVNDALSFGVK